MQSGEPGEIRKEQIRPPKVTLRETQQYHMASPVTLENNSHGGGKMDNKLIDLNARPQRGHGQASNNQVLFSSL